jgi:hypothetical protein
MEAIYIDACMKCTADVSDLRDLETIRSRVKNEGMSFLTITLPQFAKDFERALATGIIDSNDFRSFRKSQAIPAFLQGMLSQIFDRETGRIYEHNTRNSGCIADDDFVYVDSVRQICRAFAKIEIECSPERTNAAFDSYVQIEQSLHTFSLPEEDLDFFRRVSSVLWASSVSSIELSECRPKHGPGATAEGVSGNQKYLWREWNERLEPYFPLIGNGYPLGLPLDSEELKMVSLLSKEQERSVRVVPVPKTLKSPRIIAIEPCCMQYTQQGIRSALYRAIESDPITAGHVNFRDQSVNQKLAIDASATGQLATIDLSDASDRVPRSLALEMFRFHPDLMDAIDACRSNSAELPDGRVISPLLKFASMGSALCFPVEAMYFYTICIVALLKEMHLPVSHKNAFRVSRDVYVYGDDIIVPTTYADAVLDYLQKYNCKVNLNKTFVGGRFRESCGVDAYGGEPVTPVYVRRIRPENRRQASEIISWVATSNLFYLKGYWRTASLMRKTIDGIIGPLPYVSENSSVLGYISYLGYRSVERWNSGLQRLEIKSWKPGSIYRTDKIEGYSALTKALEAITGLLYDSWSPRDALNLERYALRGAVVLIRRWAPAYI